MGEIEAKFVGGDVAAALDDVRAEDLVEGLVHEVGGGVVFFGVVGVILEAAFKHALSRGLGKSAVFFELGFKLNMIDLLAFFLEKFFGDFEGEAVGLVEIEGKFT